MFQSLAIALKDLRLLMRDRSNMFFTFGFPVIFAIFFGLIFSGTGGGRIKLALVDLDGGKAAATFSRDLTSDGSFEVISAPDENTATAMIRASKADAAVFIPKGFEDQLSGMLRGESIEIKAISAPGRSAEAGLLTGKLTQLAFQQMTHLFAEPAKLKRPLNDARKALADSKGLDPIQKTLAAALLGNIDSLIERNIAKQNEIDASKSNAQLAPTPATPGFQFQPVKVTVAEVANRQKTPRSSFEVSLTQGVVWGLMGCVTAFAASLANERTRGTMMRLSVAPISKNQILMGKALGCFISCLVVQAMLVLLVTIGFNVRIGSWPMLAVAATAAAVGFTGLMMLMVGLTQSEAGASGMGRAVILVMAMIGGGTIPVFFMPPLMQKLSMISPFHWTTLAIEGSLWRDYSPQQMLLPAGVLFAVGLVGYAVGVMTMRTRTA